MKNRSFYLFWLMIALLLISFGLLIDFMGVFDTSMTGLTMFCVPGVDVLLVGLLEKLKIEKWWIHCIFYFCFVALIDLAMVFVFHIQVRDIKGALVLAAVWLLTTAICFLFHLVYQNIKKPGKTR